MTETTTPKLTELVTRGEMAVIVFLAEMEVGPERWPERAAALVQTWRALDDEMAAPPRAPNAPVLPL